MGFDAAFFILYGVFSLTMGILNKGGIRFMFLYSSTEFEAKYKRAINVVMGLLCVAIGITLYRK